MYFRGVGECSVVYSILGFVDLKVRLGGSWGVTRIWVDWNLCLESHAGATLSQRCLWDCFGSPGTAHAGDEMPRPRVRFCRLFLF